MDFGRTAQLTFGFGGLLGQDVAFERLTAFNGSTWTHAKALFGAAFRFHLWHSKFCPVDSSIFCMIAGGNISLRLDACFHLLCSGIESAAFVQDAHPRVCGLLNLRGEGGANCPNPCFTDVISSFWAPVP